MKKIKLEIELTYDDNMMYGIPEYPEYPSAKKWFFDTILTTENELILHCNIIGDDVGTVKIIKLGEIEDAPPSGHTED